MNKKIYINLYHYYETFEVGKRTIYVPCKDLKCTQKSIVKIIKKHYKLEMNTKNSAEIHCGKKYLLKMDISDFYNSFSKTQLQFLIYSIHEKYLSKFLPDLTQEKLYELITLDDKLPTGAPTSPYLANMILKNIDEKIRNKISSLYKKVNYSRYMDDLFFSSDDKIELQKIQIFVSSLLKEYSFKINFQKCKIISHNKQQKILGLLVNNKQPTLTNQTKRNYRSIIFNYLLSKSKKHIDKNMVSSLSVETLLGYLSYINSVDKVFYNRVVVYFKKNMYKLWASDDTDVKKIKRVLNSIQKNELKKQ